MTDNGENNGYYNNDGDGDSDDKDDTKIVIITIKQ